MVLDTETFALNADTASGSTSPDTPAGMPMRCSAPRSSVGRVASDDRVPMATVCDGPTPFANRMSPMRPRMPVTG